MIRNITETAKYGTHHIEITARGMTAWDRYEETTLFKRTYKLVAGRDYRDEDEDSTIAEAVSAFVPLLNRTVRVSGLPDSWIPGNADETIQANFEIFKCLPFQVMVAWHSTVVKASEPPGDPETAPPEKLTDDQKKIPASSKKETSSDSA